MRFSTNLIGFEWLSALSPASLKADAFAGLTGAAIVLPQAVAFAAIAGLPPEYGLYTAMVPAVVAGLFGSCMVMVSGPTTAISAVVFSALAGIAEPGSPEFVQRAILLALLVGVIQLGFALVRAGRLAGFVSHSVMVGFTAAAALLIGVSQLGPAMGLPPVQVHGIVDRALAVAGRVHLLEPAAAIAAGVTLCSVILLRIYLPRWPGFLIAIVLGTLSTLAMGDMAENLSYVGTLPSAYPAFGLPKLGGADLTGMMEAAFAIALIGLLEAIAIGRSLSHRTKQDFSANREVLGQGLSNVAGGLFHCYPSSGSFTRSGVNLEAGASTPFSSIFATVFLVAMVALFRPFVAMVPVAAIAGLILYVAFYLPDYGVIWHIIRSSRTETSIAAITFLVGLTVNLEFAIYIGTFSSLAVFLGRSANPELAVGAPDPNAEHRKIRNARLFHLPECPATLIVRLDGPLFFGSVDALNAKFRRLAREHPDQVNLILILQGVGEVDLPGVELIETEVERRRSKGGDVFVVVHYPPLVKKLRRFGLIKICGENRVFDNKGAAIAAAVAHVPDNRCAECRARVFAECAMRVKPGGV
ncbi:MAG: SulP family inorganic anion transporter [Roseibium sp.]|uniref:SulP family inorganic anion transporter n=1 Tax=Roseibium sp. TaxID=1936156 RepID=UPI00261C67DF|nr:SulP family inorganic anion transporter [Roseibium sp.]MCV0423929.1 SulP family inorganic anion transporter [Roseibium sp.]